VKVNEKYKNMYKYQFNSELKPTYVHDLVMQAFLARYKSTYPSNNVQRDTYNAYNRDHLKHIILSSKSDVYVVVMRECT